MFIRLMIAFAGLVLFLLTACDLPLYEKPPVADPMVIELSETDCLSKVIPVAEEFFAGEASEPKLIAAWDCAGAALSTFEKSVRGRFEDRFTSRELAHFIEQYFLNPGTRVPDPLLQEIFRIKQLFVGGAIDSITRQEMKNLISVVQEMRRITLNVNPYMKIYSFNWKWVTGFRLDDEIQNFENANLAIQQGAKDLGALIQKNGQAYDLNNVIFLLKELEKFNSSNWTWIAGVDKAMPLVKKLKKTLTGGDEAVISPLEWYRFSLLGARGFIQYLRYFYFVKSSDLTNGGSELAYMIRTVGDLFDYLGDMVDGKPGQKLTRSELLEVLQSLTDFAPDFKVSDPLLVEIMKIKVIFFGGSVDVFEKVDFDTAIQKLESFQKLTEIFIKHLMIYSFDWKPNNLPFNDAQARFDDADRNLVNVAQSLGDIMDRPYDLQDLKQLAIEIDALYDFEFSDGKNLTQLANQYLPLIITAKNIIFSDQGSVIGALELRLQDNRQQWSQFLEVTAKLYSRFMHFEYFLKDQPMTEDRGLLGFNRLVLDSSFVLDEIIEKKPQKLISFSELHSILQNLKQADFLPESLSVSVLNSLMRPLVQKILLSPENRLAGQIPSGLGRLATAEFRKEFSIWVQNQAFLDMIYYGIPGVIGKSGASLMADIQAATPTEGLSELKMILSGQLALSFDGMGRLQFSQPPANYQKKTMTLMNSVRAAYRLVMRAYSQNLSNIQNYRGITEADANAFYADVRALVVELELISPQNDEFATSRFRDANLFTSVGNGDDLASFQEGSTLFMMILSGIKVDSMIYEKLEKACDIEKPTPEKYNWKVSVACVRKVYRDFIPGTFNNMPDFLKFHVSQSEGQFKKTFENLLKATGAVIETVPDQDENGPADDSPPVPGDGSQPEDDNQIEKNQFVKIEDLGLYAHVVQYIEGIFQVYDQSRNGLLETQEAMKAYPKYKALLKNVSGLSSEKELRGLFAWLLKHGKPPTSLQEKLTFKLNWCKMNEEDWELSAGRDTLASILGFIADAMKVKTPTPWFLLTENF
ncbi:MAG: hypothetical protein ACAH59_01370 [Pseudobdellovibrionaceae bacterium]